MSRMARRVAWIACGVLTLQFIGALLVQAALSREVRGEVIRQMTRGMDDSGALVGCVSRPGPWHHSDGLWTVWPLTDDGTPVGHGAPVEAVALPSRGTASDWASGGSEGLVYASTARDCGGVLVQRHSAYPIFESRPGKLARLVLIRLALVVLAGVALVALTAGPLVRRVRRLADAMRGVVADNFAGSVDDGTRDELGDVAAAFDAAAETARERMQQLEFRDQVVRHALADFAHDARTPLATLKLAASSLPATAPATTIRSEIDFLEGMTHTLEALLEGNREQALTIVAADALAQRLEGRFAPLVRDRGLTLATALPDTPLHVRAESIALERAASNLIQNAVRFASAQIAILVFERDGEVRLEVRDDGPGFGELRRRASERGTRGLKSAADGSGLGLAIAEASARRFGGRLETGDAEEGGALVALVLPSVPPPR